jgi:putative endonuclease
LCERLLAARYNVDKLVYYEVADDPTAAIMREKQIKAGSRRKKIELVSSMNPAWRDLAETSPAPP